MNKLLISIMLEMIGAQLGSLTDELAVELRAERDPLPPRRMHKMPLEVGCFGGCDREDHYELVEADYPIVERLYSLRQTVDAYADRISALVE